MILGKTSKNRCRFYFFLGIVLGAIGLIVILAAIFLFQDWRNERLWEVAIYNQEEEHYEDYKEQDIEQMNYSNKEAENNIVDIIEIPISAVTMDDYGRLFYINKDTKKKVYYNGHPASHLHISPLGNKFGFCEEFNIYDKSIPYDRQIVLHVSDIDTKSIKEIYHGSHRTSSWEWFDNNYVLVYYNCGTECRALYKINVNTGKQTDISKNFGYGVGYQWSSNKRYVLAYHYTSNYGISVGDKNGNIIFRMMRDPAPGIMITDVKALWSPDSSKIVLIIKKEEREILEALVFDINQDFKIIFQEDLVGNIDDIEISWQNQGKVLVYKDLDGRREKAFRDLL